MPDTNNPYSPGIATPQSKIKKFVWPRTPTITLLIIAASTALLAAYQIARFETTSRAILGNERSAVERLSIPVESTTYAKLVVEVAKYQGIVWAAYFPVVLINAVHFATLLRIARTINKPRRITWLYILATPYLSPGVVLGIPVAIWMIRRLTRETEVRQNLA